MAEEYKWYVAVTAPRHRLEFSVMHALHQSERAAMVPFEEKAIKRKGKRFLEKKRFPLFPRYVFVQLPVGRLRSEFHALKGVDGVQGLISASRLEFRPLALNPEQVATITRLSTEGFNGATEVNLHRAFQPGTTVKILQGPFMGRPAIVDSVTRKAVNVMLEMFSSTHVIPISAEQLAVA